MAIVIENMQMPENCCICPFIQYDDYASGCPFHCPITHTSFEEDDCYAMKNRYEKCPLQEQKTGKWIGTEDKDEQYGYVYKCSVCGTSTIGDSERFCGWCGARMDKE